MNGILAIILGGSMGAVCRHLLFLGVHRLTDASFPLGTLAVNLTGCLGIGLLWGLFEHSNIGEEWRLFLFTGFFGSFTTFSTFAREALQLFKVGETKVALTYLLASNLLGIFLVLAGMLAAQRILGALPR